MSLSPEERITMRDLHLERCDMFLHSADTCYENGDYFTAANRYYYACFHAVHALFVMNEIYARSHDGMNVQFSQYFVKTGIFEPRFGSLIAKMEQLRDKADYNIFYKITAESISDKRPIIVEFIACVKQYLQVA